MTDTKTRPTRLVMNSGVTIDLRSPDAFDTAARAGMLADLAGIVHGVDRTESLYEGSVHIHLEPTRAVPIWGALITRISHPELPSGRCSTLDELRMIAAGVQSNPHHEPISAAARTIAANALAEINGTSAAARLLQVFAA